MADVHGDQVKFSCQKGERAVGKAVLDDQQGGALLPLLRDAHHGRVHTRHEGIVGGAQMLLLQRLKIIKARSS